MKYLLIAVLFVSCSVVKIKHKEQVNFIPGEGWQVVEMTHADSILLDSIVRNYHD